MRTSTFYRAAAVSLAHSLGKLNSESDGKPTPPRQYFPIKTRTVDYRVDNYATTHEAQITRRRSELRTEVDTSAVRQVDSFASGRPTHFLALRLPQRTNFRKVAATMFEEIKFSHPRFTGVLVPPARFHLTISTFQIEQASLEQSVNIISDTVATAFPSGHPFRLHLRGLGTFAGGRVIFARAHSCSESYRLDNAVKELRKSLSASSPVSIRLQGNAHDGFVPHVTLAKISKSQAAEFGRSIPTAVWSPFQHQLFGDVTFTQLDLCEMRVDDSTGYYNVVQSFSL
ncbi:AKAP7 2'5' RNA ligase-like domain-containing protein, putative [Bodo saltans]|uniref:AKAP7 2'5' RNA ligase-like domain-containing protein, putative n=1 Tax=Bodo saltans TaxID=75058 RepID=A0A0S4KLM6_BODSA|nr:AKAP7 2'5' RNA ligase-like domain-containing protein, putative [Bodo saltans]|eukprot:CUI15488.1 AKAP7 2'5' RNA ligase-like domain-containing protein, putative [Bodo saltans]